MPKTRTSETIVFQTISEHLFFEMGWWLSVNLWDPTTDTYVCRVYIAGVLRDVLLFGIDFFMTY